MSSLSRLSKKEMIAQMKMHLNHKFHLTSEQADAMIPTFLTTLADHMLRLEKNLDSGDLYALGRAGHTMKGALLNLGLEDCATIAGKIEMQGKELDNATDYKGLLAALRSEIGPLLD